MPWAALSYRILGRFEVRRDGVPVAEDAWKRPMAARLVRFLLVHRGATVAEDQILEGLWPGRPPAAAHRCLAVAASQARLVLGEPVLHAADRTYTLEIRPADRVDAEDFERAAGVACGAGDRAALAAAAGLWTGEPLPADRYADWAGPWRDDLVDRYREVLTARADAELRERDAAAALRSARALLALDPLDEGAHRRAMQAHAALGRRVRALEQYAACRRLLVERAGLEPSGETTALQAEILRGARHALASGA
jgi:DNA-binding SARP family transcriptional activator